MKVLVPVKRVIDPYVKIQVKADGSGVVMDNMKMSMNPFDEIAIEEAVKWLEQGLVDEIIAVSIGPNASQEILRRALAFGASKAILVETAEPLEPLAVAKTLKKIVEDHSIDLVMMGKQAIDDDCNQTGQMLASLLDWPQATFASKIAFEDSKTHAMVTREIDGGLETLKVRLPAVITADLRLNEPRYLGLPNIMKAKKKPLDVFAFDTLGVDGTPRLQTTKVRVPEPRQAGIMVQSVDELIDCLRNKEKVI